MVVEAVNGGTQVLGLVSIYREVIMHLISKKWTIIVNKCSREANGVADKIGKEALSVPRGYHGFSQPLPCLIFLLKLDLAQCTYSSLRARLYM